MAKLIGLFIFLNFFLTGIKLGNSKKQLTTGTVLRTLAYFIFVYTGLAIYIANRVELFRPHY